MKKNFNFKDIAHLTQYVHKNVTNEMIKNHFEYMANSYKDELDKLAYAELIKKTIENMADLPTTINKNIYYSLTKQKAPQVNLRRFLLPFVKIEYWIKKKERLLHY
ncbi:Mbov_0392 family ICE element protein, partial [Mycoplasmopsis bovis]|uniref:Mbov_0392 family ICE element protein n=1 Tax=Mycoplasmopsis bovis TaxID=28903 RepID=UPI002962381E